MLLLTPLHVFHMRIGDFRKAMLYADQVAGLSRTTQDVEAIALSRILTGFSYHYAGELNRARQELEAGLHRDPGAALTSGQGDVRSVTMKGDAMAAPILALASSAAADALARTLWLQGHPAAALDYVHQTLRDAARAEHPVTLLVALMYAISVLIWNGDLDEAGEQIRRLIAKSASYALQTHVVLGHCFEGQLAVSRGDMERGVEILRTCLHDLRALRYELLTTSFTLSLAEGFAAIGRFAEGIALIDTAMQSVETNGDLLYMPELLRVKATLLLRLPQPLEESAEACLM
jgi:tetratricopeptide (TPR) repeat protein